MRYLISNQVRVLSYCLKNYSDLWDIIPYMLRLSQKHPSFNEDTLIGLSNLNRIRDLIIGAQANVNIAKKEGIVFDRPKYPDKVRTPLFKYMDGLVEKISKLKGHDTSIKNKIDFNNLPLILAYMGNATLSVISNIEKEKENISKDTLTHIRDIALDMRNFTPKVVTAIQDLRKINLKTARRDLKVYIDMDNVLTDFDKAVKKLGPKAAKGLSEDASEEEKQVMYDAIEEAGSKFWSEMEWMPEGKELWAVVKKYNPVLLSSPGLFKWAPAGKENWVNKNLPGVSLFLDENKHYYAEMDAILIDDMLKNIYPWRDAGGIGILYENDAQATKKEIEDIFNQSG